MNAARDHGRGPDGDDIHAICVADGEGRVVVATSDDEREPDWLPVGGPA
jgi:hypothetical protein